MRSHRNLLGILLALAAAAPGRAQAPAYSLLAPDAFQSFVRNWSPPSRPLCAAMRTQADWDAVMAPAPIMGMSKPFAPPAEIWSRKGVLLVARMVDAGDMATTFRMRGLLRDAAGLELAYDFVATPTASSSVKWWLGMTVDQPLPPAIRVVENDRVICTLAPAAGTWRTVGAP